MSKNSSESSKTLVRIRWIWKNENVDSSSVFQSDEWQFYDDIDNKIIEDAFLTNENQVLLDDYTIHFKNQIQISNSCSSKQYPIKRISYDIKDSPVRGERFITDLITPKIPFNGLLGWIPLFIKEAAKFFNVTIDNLPSNDQTKVSIIVEQAAAGILEQSKLIGKRRRGEKLAQMLLDKKDAGMEEVWKLCAHLYTWDSFLHRKVNEIMRLVDDKDYEEEWRKHIQLLGAYCLLLWDNPFSKNATQRKEVLYRGANLTEALILDFKNHSSYKRKPHKSFQSFTSCSRDKDKEVAEIYGNVLFIMTVKHAFTVDLKPHSMFPDEEEELIFPGVAFTIDTVDFDESTQKHRIYLSLIQQFRTSNCDKTFIDDVPFSTKVEESPIIVIGTSLNKTNDIHIRNLFNVTFLVSCILKGRPTQRVINIVQAGSLLGRRACQKLNINQHYIVFLQPFFDNTYRPTDFEEILYSARITAVLAKTCGLSRIYPFTDVNHPEASLTNKCPSSVSIHCPLENPITTKISSSSSLSSSSSSSSTTTTTTTTMLTTTTVTTITAKTSDHFIRTTKSIDDTSTGKNSIDLAILSLLLSENQQQNLSFSFFQGQNHKSLFSDIDTRQNAANQLSSIVTINLIFFSFLNMF